MIKIKCDKCNKELDKTGALIFSPPAYYGITEVESYKVMKFHICRSCYSKLCDWMEAK